MTDDRDICDLLEDHRIDGAMSMRRDAAKEIRYLRYYVAQLENDLVEEERQHGKTIVKLEEAREHSSKQALDIVTLGQEVGRLRENLLHIVEAWDWWQVDTYDRCQSVPSDAINEARAALAEKEST